jgi:hypothetical protein
VRDWELRQAKPDAKLREFISIFRSLAKDETIRSIVKELSRHDKSKMYLFDAPLQPWIVDDCQRVKTVQFGFEYMSLHADYGCRMVRIGGSAGED